jgi:hypothetical protein
MREFMYYNRFASARQYADGFCSSPLRNDYTSPEGRELLARAGEAGAPPNVA